MGASGRATVICALVAALLGACLDSDPSHSADIVASADAGGKHTAASPTTHAPQIVITQEHFRLTIDGSRGGEITDLQLFDGSAWNHVLGDGSHTFPAATLRSEDTDFALARANGARL
ncbi:MAG: hypothetical protein JWP87_6158, partial [Labilithrix sp.]|nr:hypothetical protein [Labilithrix sp.]